MMYDIHANTQRRGQLGEVELMTSLTTPSEVIADLERLNI